MVNNPKPNWISTLIGWIILSGLLGWGGNGVYRDWLKPKLELRSSDTWTITPCKVLNAKVKETRGKDNVTLFTPEVSYEYQTGGQTYSSTQVWFGFPSTVIALEASQVVDPLGEGGNFECYVNPTSPKESVLVRKMNPVQGYGVILAMIAVGVGGLMLMSHLFYILSLLRKSILGKTAAEINIERAMANATCPIESGEPDEPLIVKATESRVAVAGCLWIFALIWNCVTWGVAYGSGFKIGGLLIFLAIFAIVGLAIMFGAIYATLQIANPRPILVCSQRDIYPGSEFEISWMFQGKVSKINHLQVILEGVEEAKYREGTNTRTDKSIFFKNELIDSSDPQLIAEGFKLISIPLETMHTFKSANNSFLWQIRVVGKISLWPDIHDRFEILVLAPKPLEAIV